MVGKSHLRIYKFGNILTLNIFYQLVYQKYLIDNSINVLYQRALFFLFFPEFFHRLQPQPLLPLQLHDVGHAQQVLLVPISGRKNDRLVQEVADRVEQFVLLFDDATYFLKFLKKIKAYAAIEFHSQ